MLSEVISALNQHVKDYSRGIDIAVNNTGFKPDPDRAWLSVFFQPTGTEGVTFGDTGLDQTTGFYQIDINTPVNKGFAELYYQSDRMQRSFRLGAELVYDGHGTHILRTERSPDRVVDGYYRVSVTVYWMSYNRRDGLPGDFLTPANLFRSIVNTTLPDLFAATPLAS